MELKNLKIEDNPEHKYDYDRLKKAKCCIKSIKIEQSSCHHNFISAKRVSHKKYIHDKSRIVSIINSIISNIFVKPEYVRICEYCGKAEYFYTEDEANSYPAEGRSSYLNIMLKRGRKE